MRTSGIAPFKPPTHMTDAVLSQANPVSGTPYGVIGTTLDMRIVAIIVQCTWTVQPDPLEVHVLIDGITLTGARANPVSDTPYYMFPSFSDLTGDTWNLNPTPENAFRRAFLLEGRSIIVSAEITGGTVQNLDARLLYALYR